MTQRATALSIGAIVLVVLASHLSLAPKVADLDGFYHIGHAAAYVEGSAFDTSLPWATRSVIRDRGADLWWGFHLVLTPFAAFDDPADGVRVAAIVLTLIFALGLFWVLRRHGVPEAGVWVALLLIAVPNVLYQFLSVRPRLLTMLLALALVSVLSRGKWWQAGLVALAITWLHLGFFWMAPGIVCAYILIRLVSHLAGEQTPDDDRRAAPGPALLAVFAGSALGWLLRPHPIEAGMLANVQILLLMLEKTTSGQVPVVDELRALPTLELARTSWAFLLAWITASGVAIHRLVAEKLEGVRVEERTFLFTGLVVSVVFLVLTVVTARRALIQWVCFGFLVVPLAWTYLTDEATRRRLRLPMTVLLVAHLGWGARRHLLNVDLVAFPGDTFEEVASFLERNSDPGDVVFHGRWDNFGPLFARNRTNHYIGGMDPIFQFAHDTRSYWEYFYLSADVNTEFTCDAAPPCMAGTRTDTYQAVRDHFGARWVLTEPRRNPRFTLYLLNDPRFELALETEREALFEVLPGTDTPIGEP